MRGARGRERELDVSVLLAALTAQDWRYTVGENREGGSVRYTATPPEGSPGRACVVHFAISRDERVSCQQAITTLRRQGFVWPPPPLPPPASRAPRRAAPSTPHEEPIEMAKQDRAPSVAAPQDTSDRVFANLKEARLYLSLAKTEQVVRQQSYERARTELASADAEVARATEDMSRAKAAFDEVFFAEEVGK